MTITASIRMTVTLACIIGCAGCEKSFDPAAPASSGYVDVITSNVPSCPAIKPMLAAALTDDSVTMGEVRTIAEHVSRLSEESRRADSYAEARKAAGLPPRSRKRPCSDGFTRDLHFG